MYEVFQSLLAIGAVFAFVAGFGALVGSFWSRRPGESLSLDKPLFSLVLLLVALWYYSGHRFAGENSIALVAIIFLMLGVAVARAAYIFVVRSRNSRSEAKAIWFQGKQENETEKEYDERARTSYGHDRLE